MAKLDPSGDVGISRPSVRTFSVYCRQKYGFAVGKLPVDLGVPCTNRKLGGCIYCRASSFRPGYLRPSDNIERQVAKGKEQFLSGRFTKYFVYFQQETPTAMDQNSLVSLSGKLLMDPACVGLIFSTRPDCLEDSLLKRLAEITGEGQKDCLFELGLQSIHDKSLRLLNRNHSYDDFLMAYEKLRGHGCFEVGVHLIMGIPGESQSDMVETVDTVCALGVDSLKLHHLQVIRGTPLEEMYRLGQVEPLRIEEYLELLMLILPRIPCDVTIQRLWAASHPSVLVAPRWGLTSDGLSRQLQKLLLERDLWQGKFHCRVA